MSNYDISPDEDLVTAARLAKGDLEVVKNWRGRVTHAIPKNLTIIKELIGRRVFPQHYDVYGVGFMEMRAAFRAPWMIRSSAVLLEQWGVGVSNSRANEAYLNVCRILGIRRTNVVEFVMEQLKEREDHSHHQTYKDSFEYLIDAMDHERERIYLEQKLY